jgi:hypothetical protein
MYSTVHRDAHVGMVHTNPVLHGKEISSIGLNLVLEASQ